MCAVSKGLWPEGPPHDVKGWSCTDGKPTMPLCDWDLPVTERPSGATACDKNGTLLDLEFLPTTRGTLVPQLGNLTRLKVLYVRPEFPADLTQANFWQSEWYYPNRSWKTAGFSSLVCTTCLVDLTPVAPCFRHPKLVERFQPK
jgi:hypothetical protein